MLESALSGGHVLPLYTQVLFWNIPTFRLAVSLAIVLTMAIGIYRQPSRGRLIDIYLGALVLGILGARVFHVLLNWNYFSDNLAEITLLQAGGLDWHGALWGGLLGMVLVTRGHHWLNSLRGKVDPVYSFNHLLVLVAPALPFMGLGGWIGCFAAGCGYGKEVDSLANYPWWMTSELVDVFGIVAPRYNTPYFGIALCMIGLVSVVGMRRWHDARRFWWLVVIMSLGMFIIGLYRADHSPIIAGLRGDQILDMIMALWGMVILMRSGKRTDEKKA